MLLDTAHAADKMFGPWNWRLYVASDAPGVRRYAQHLLQAHTPKNVWNKGIVGHNYMGGQTTTLEEKIETSIGAFADVLIMIQSDLLVSLSSKFPKAGEMIGMCPQRAIHFPGHPRHDLATNGGLLTRSVSPTQTASSSMMQKFWKLCPRVKTIHVQRQTIHSGRVIVCSSKGISSVNELQ